MKLFLIDGHALVFKMYYAFLGRPMVNSKGVDTSILFGFTKYLLELIDRERPTHIAVSFDPPGGTFRNELYPEYKANRGETPALVVEALEPLTRIVEALDIPVLMLPGYEADDVIGSAAKRFEAEGFEVFMVTPDKDYGQLITPHILQVKPGKGGGENELLGVAEVCDKWKIASPTQVIDILAICGDASDNVPGVQGVGPVGAAKLLGKYGSVEGIYAHLDELTARQQEQFRAAEGHIALSKRLVTIKTDIPLDVTADQLVFDTVETPELNALLDHYEMPSLKRLIKKVAIADKPIGATDLQSRQQPAATVAARGLMNADGCLSAKKVALNLQGEKLFVGCEAGVAEGSIAEFKDLLEDAAVTKVGIDLKGQMKKFADAGITLAGRLEDIELMHYLLGPERSHKLDVLEIGRAHV